MPERATVNKELPLEFTLFTPTYRAHAREEEQRRQRAPVRLNRVRSAVTQKVKVVVAAKARIHAV